MNLEFSEDQKFIQHTAREFLTEHAGPDACRKVVENPELRLDQELWKGVAEMGWLGATVPESYGGAGLSYLELVLIAEEIGRALAPIPFSSSVYGATEALLLAGSEAQKSEYLPRLVAGDLIGTLAFAEGPGAFDATSTQCVFADESLSGVKAPVPDGQSAGLAVVYAREAGAGSLVLVDLEQSGVERGALDAIDPSRPLARLSFDGAAATRLGETGQGDALLSALVDRAAVMTGFEQIGGAAQAFDVTKEFTMGRYAFGRPIASFQALKHRMADVYAAIEVARSNGYFAAWALSSANAELPVAACSLRVAACEAFELATEEMIQMHGGVGFTWEYDCHLYYRRAQALAAGLGRAPSWRDLLIERLEAQGAMA
jgi:alkylation response protein AidB-like acyl-CoA dehydrogenase